MKIELTHEMILKYFIKKNTLKIAMLDLGKVKNHKELERLSKILAKDKKELRKLKNK